MPQKNTQETQAGCSLSPATDTEPDSSNLEKGFQKSTPYWSDAGGFQDIFLS